MTRLKFWGVRGSIPSPGPSTLRYGGNTSCLEVRNEDRFFIFDAGSGIRELGNSLLNSGQNIKGHIFISHLHWDHIQGIPFFTPAYIPGNEFTFYSAKDVNSGLKELISSQMDSVYFPVEMDDMCAELQFHALQEGRFEVDNIPVETIFVNHPGNALGYKLYLDDTILVYISDNEPFESAPAENADDYIGEDGNEKLIEFISGSDILVHDAQYTPEEYESKVTWGHSPYDYTVNLALRAGVKKLFLFHHDPMHNDEKVDEILAGAKSLAASSDSRMEIEAAREGLMLEI